MRRQKIPETSYTRDDIADIGIVVTSRNGEGKIMQPTGMKNKLSPRIRERNQFSQFRRTSYKVLLMK